MSLVGNKQVEALIRAMVEHFAAWGGLPLLAVSAFDQLASLFAAIAPAAIALGRSSVP